MSGHSPGLLDVVAERLPAPARLPGWLSAPIPSSLLGSPMSPRRSSQVANLSGGRFKHVSQGSHPEADKQPGSLQLMMSWNRAGTVLPSAQQWFGRSVRSVSGGAVESSRRRH